MSRIAVLIAAALALGSPEATSAQVSLARPFGDHMVLQRGEHVPVFGSASPWETIELTFGTATVTATADAAGRWHADLGPLAADRVPRDLVALGSSGGVTVRDVLVGEVWMASGQSNMEWPLRLAGEFDAARTRLHRPQIRLCAMEGAVRPGKQVQESEQLERLVPETFFDLRWTPSARSSAPEFSAVAWFFAERLADELRVPIGVIDNAYGGSAIEAWLPREVLLASPETRLLGQLAVDGWIADETTFPWVREQAEQDLGRWRERASLFGMPPPQHHPFEPAFLWEAAVQPFAGFGLRGVIWYQGESNAHDPALYEFMFRKFVPAWRRWLDAPELVFEWTQLAAYGPGSDWPEVRERQRACLDLGNCGMAVTIDVGHPESIHPPRKEPVGRRLAGLALHDVYGRIDLAREGPRPIAAIREDLATIRVIFTSADGLALRAGEGFGGFELLDAAGTPLTVTGELAGTTVLLTVPAGFEPLAVRYAWAPYPSAPLVNGAGLPAVPFRLVLQ